MARFEADLSSLPLHERLVPPICRAGFSPARQSECVTFNCSSSPKGTNMKTKSLYSELAVNLFSRYVERCRPKTHATGRDRSLACAGGNDRSSTAGFYAMNPTGHERVPKKSSCSSGTSQNFGPDHKQEKCARTRTDLAADSRFTSFSADLFRCQQRTDCESLEADILAYVLAEIGAPGGKSAHAQSFQTRSWQGVPFFSLPWQLGYFAPRHFWFFKQLLCHKMSITHRCAIQN